MKNDNTVDQFEVGELTVRIEYHTEPENPREDFDHMGKMVCWHRNYRLGDKNEFSSPEEFEEYAKAEKLPLVLPLYLYDHSGLSMSVGGFSCPWDSGQVGWIYVTRKAILENFMAKKLTKKVLEQAHKVLLAEVEEFDQYLTGQVYGFIVEDKDGNHLESCWGFYGLEYCVSEARGAAETLSENLIGAGNGI